MKYQMTDTEKELFSNTLDTEIRREVVNKETRN